MKMLAWLLWLVLVATLSLPSILFAVAQAKIGQIIWFEFHGDAIKTRKSEKNRGRRCTN